MQFEVQEKYVCNFISNKYSLRTTLRAVVATWRRGSLARKVPDGRLFANLATFVKSTYS